MRLDERTVEQVRKKASILDQFDPAKIKKLGLEYLARCPWHDDQRPSLSISPAKNFAYCPVCARAVDAIGWLQDRQGLSFSDAVIQLAEQYGIEVKAANEEDTARFEAEQQQRAQLYRQREEQIELFQKMLDGSPAREYLQSRGLKASTIESWQLGWNGSRVMFPLRDPQGRVVGFTGRVLDDSKPKYKNSRNDLIYQKSQLVFGLDRARNEIIRSGQVVITEGQFDVIRCFQEGIANMVAVSGSSLTKSMVETLVKTCKVREVVLCFDGDTGGEKAADRAIGELQGLALRGELSLKILSLPPGKDPADCAEQMAGMLADAPHWVQFSFEKRVGQVDLNDPQAIAVAERGVRQILQILPEGPLREYVQRRSRQVLRAVPDVVPAKILTQRQIDRCRWAERRALRLYLLSPDSRPPLSEIKYTDPIMLQFSEFIETLESMGVQAGNIASVFRGLMSRSEDLLRDEARSLTDPLPEVLRAVLADPVCELQGALDVLTGDCCTS